MRSIVSKLIAHLQPDIVHYHSLLNFSMGAPEVASRAGIPSVYTSHNVAPRVRGCTCSKRTSSFVRALPMMATSAQPVSAGRTRLLITLCGSSAADGCSTGILACTWCVESCASTFYRERPLTFAHPCVAAGRRRLTTSGGRSAAGWPPENSSTRPLRVGFIGSLLGQKGIHVLVVAGEAFEAGQIEIHVFRQRPCRLRQGIGKKSTGRIWSGFMGITNCPGFLRSLVV